MYALLLRLRSHDGVVMPREVRYVYGLVSTVASCLRILHLLPDRQLALIYLTVVVQGQPTRNQKASVRRALQLLLEA